MRGMLCMGVWCYEGDAVYGGVGVKEGDVMF